jgi:hypothetical protein
MMVVFTLGAAAIAALSVGLVILGFQWFTKIPVSMGLASACRTDWGATPGR